MTALAALAYAGVTTSGEDRSSTAAISRITAPTWVVLQAADLRG
jgi:hypothetical protein